MTEQPHTSTGDLAQTGAEDDDSLAQRARSDPAAFATLYRRHLDPVYRYLLVRLGDHHLAQDATAQTFLAALEGIASYRGQGKFAAWLLSIARHKSADAFRERRPNLSLEVAETLPATTPSPERIVAARIQLEQVARALRTIAPERAEALALRVVGGLSLAETSVVMGKSEAAVKMLVHRAVTDLRERLSLTLEAES